jgi:hypothetical protein
LTFSKYVLYPVVLFVVFGVWWSPHVFHLLTYSTTHGNRPGFQNVEHFGGRHKVTDKHPVIRFEHNGYQYKFLAPSFLQDVVDYRNDIPVIFDPDDPSEAYVKSFIGLIGDSLLYLIPFFLIWTVLVLHPEFFPRYFTVTIDKDKGVQFKKLS